MRLTRSRQRSSGHSAVAVLTLGPAGFALVAAVVAADSRGWSRTNITSFDIRIVRI